MPFKFKQFSVSDDRSTMKVGTDAVLLGAWVNVDGAKTILDIGTGCGVIALMLAQRSDAFVTAIDIDEDSANQATGNFRNSIFSDRLHAHCVPLQEFDGAYDLIVSNPPFFSKSLLPPDSKRLVARHTEELSFDDLLHSIKRLLKDDGRFAVVLPITEGNTFIEKSKVSGFHCIRKTSVYPRAKLERYLLEFSQFEKIPLEDVLVLHDGEKRSEGYQKLTGEFYLGTF